MVESPNLEATLQAVEQQISLPSTDYSLARLGGMTATALLHRTALDQAGNAWAWGHGVYVEDSEGDFVLDANTSAALVYRFNGALRFYHAAAIETAVAAAEANLAKSRSQPKPFADRLAFIKGLASHTLQGYDPRDFLATSKYVNRGIIKMVREGSLVPKEVESDPIYQWYFTASSYLRAWSSGLSDYYSIDLLERQFEKFEAAQIEPDRGIYLQAKALIATHLF